MKKLFTLLFIAGAMSIVSCGPSKADQEKAAKAVQAQMDSLAKVSAAAIDAAATSAPTDTTKAAPAK